MRFFKYILAFSLVVLTACEGVITEEDISDIEVRLLSPTNNAEISTNLVRFDWREVEGARSYNIQIATPSFGSPDQFLLDTQVDSLTTYEFELTEGRYQWRVKAMNEGYETRYSRASFDVVPVANFSDNTVILSSPENNLITNESSQILNWQEVDGATLYRLQVLENDAVVGEESTTGTQQTFSFPEGNITWQVRAENGSENTLYSARSLLIDVTDPNTPALTLPQDEAVLAIQDVSFEWTRELINGSVEFDSIYIYRDENLTDLVESNEATSPYATNLVNDTYYWFVKAFDEAGNESNDSAIFSFTIDN